MPLDSYSTLVVPAGFFFVAQRGAAKKPFPGTFLKFGPISLKSTRLLFFRDGCPLVVEMSVNAWDLEVNPV